MPVNDSALLGNDFVLCEVCARLRNIGASFPSPATGWTCDAFPAGIPPEIVRMDWDHREFYDDGEATDHGLRFKPAPGDEKWTNRANQYADDQHPPDAEYVPDAASVAP